MVWDDAVSKYYYDGWPWPDWKTLVKRNLKCYDSPVPHFASENYDCYIPRWNDSSRSLPSAQDLLDLDLSHGRPDIVKISGRDIGGGDHPVHFVLVAGYDSTFAGTELGRYSAYDPGRTNPNPNFEPPQPLGGYYTNLAFVQLYRYIGVYSRSDLNSEFRISVHSPVEIQIIDPMNRRTGYDPETGLKLQENPLSLYFSEEPPSSLDGDDVPEEPVKILNIVKPIAGNYILKIFGTGDGPYTIDMQGIKDDGTENLNTSITGTATPTLLESYRITYSPTGDASLSQTNQAPIANAGTNQTGEQSYEITLDGTASNDPDGDPLKYAWRMVTKPDDSIAMLSDATAVMPTFTPDKAGTYVLQLVVNDYFTDSETSTVTIHA